MAESPDKNLLIDLLFKTLKVSDDLQELHNLMDSLEYVDDLRVGAMFVNISSSRMGLSYNEDVIQELLSGNSNENSPIT